MQFKGNQKPNIFRAVGLDYFVYVQCQCHRSPPKKLITPLKSVLMHICIIPDKPFLNFFSEYIQ